MKKASPKMVGGFVIGAVLLAVTAVVIFGTGRFFEERRKLVAFFTDSIAGLRLGAPVEFRGIPVGTVTDIWIEIDPETVEHIAPVVFEVDVEKFRGAEKARVSVGDVLIERGLRAQLSVQSFVTGQQTIQLDFFPDTPIRLIETDLPYGQIPTIPAQIQEFQRTLDQVGDEAVVVLNRLGQLLTADNRELIHKTLENVADLTGNLRSGTKEVGPLVSEARTFIESANAESDEISELIDNANATILSYRTLAQDGVAILDENRAAIKEAIAGLRQTEASIERVADQGAKLIAENRRGVSDFTNTGLYEITNLAIDAQAAVEQLRRVLEEMERDPARFFLGKPGEVEVR